MIEVIQENIKKRERRKEKATSNKNKFKELRHLFSYMFTCSFGEAGSIKIYVVYPDTEHPNKFSRISY